MLAFTAIISDSVSLALLPSFTVCLLGNKPFTVTVTALQLLSDEIANTSKNLNFKNKYNENYSMHKRINVFWIYILDIQTLMPLPPTLKIKCFVTVTFTSVESPL